MSKKTIAIIDLGYGDGGKGKAVHRCCLNSEKESTIVVRFSGGQQAGHTVLLKNGVKHIHSSYPSGTLGGVSGYVSEHCTVNLPAMKKEWEILATKTYPVLCIHPLAKITTKFDIAFGKAREKKYGHGSCGMGVGATMARNILSPYKLHVIDLTNKWAFEQKLKTIQEYYSTKAFEEGFSDWYNTFVDQEIDSDIDWFFKYVSIENYDFLQNYNTIIFEGSQGILLDKDHGIFPHVTFANTTSKNAVEIAEKIGRKLDIIYYVTRAYGWRHGTGPFIEEPIELIPSKEEINKNNKWQGPPRTGFLDYEVIKYALDIDTIYSKDCNKNILISCLDQCNDLYLQNHLNPLIEKLSKEVTSIWTSNTAESNYELI